MFRWRASSVPSLRKIIAAKVRNTKKKGSDAKAEDVLLYERGGGNAAPHLGLYHSYVIIRYSPLHLKQYLPPAKELVAGAS